MNDGPLIVQSDKTLLLEIEHERAQDCRKAIAPFAELERSPEHVHTYRLTPLGLWNARAAGHDAEQVVDTLLTYSRYAVPHALLVDIAETMARYGRLRLEKHPTHGLVLISTSFYVKRWIGQRAWRAIHFGSIGVFAASLVHGIWAGTDSSRPMMIGLYNKAIEEYQAVGVHDGTGVGNVVDDYVEFSDTSHKFVMVGRPRTELLIDYITDFEHGMYELPIIPTNPETQGVVANPLYRAHRAVTVADVYAPGKWNSHLPDDFASMALAHRAIKELPQPITKSTEVPKSGVPRMKEM